jgi:DNA invertase Pin-like site-specific DNA recombinase
MRAALYARTACLTQDLNSAVELQLEALRNYATRNGMEIVEEFTDAGHSGLRRDRPGLNRMCDVAGRRGFDVLLIRDPERLARNSVLQVSLLEEFEQFGVRTIFFEGRPSEEWSGELSGLGEKRGTSWPHFASPEQGCQRLPSNRRISCRGGQ